MTKEKKLAKTKEEIKEKNEMTYLKLTLFKRMCPLLFF